MTSQQLEARLQRLQNLGMGLRRESQKIGTGYEPMTPQEWFDYASALVSAARALDAARIPLARALQRSQPGGSPDG